MRLAILCRISVLMPVFAYIICLGGCTQSGPTEKGASSRGGILLEDMGNGVCRQLPSGLMWQIDESRKFATWEEANEYASSLELAGFNDWRLPTRDECLDYSELLLLKKGDCPITFKRAHWVTGKRKSKSGYWDDYPLCGGSELRWIKGKQGTVRAVRP